MKKILGICLVVVSLLNACSSAPTPTIDFQIIGSDGINNFAIISTTDTTNRDGLLSVANYVCKDSDYCYIYFWNNITYASNSFPLMQVQEDAVVAIYRQNITTGQKDLLICALGEC